MEMRGGGLKIRELCSRHHMYRAGTQDAPQEMEGKQATSELLA